MSWAIPSPNPWGSVADVLAMGWLVVVELADAGELDQLMDAAAYSDLVAES